MKVSCLILTRDEAVNLPACLATVGWCDDIVVLDSGSRDATVELARQGGARVLERPFTDFADQRNHGIEHGAWRHDWILHLDADERVTPELAGEIERVTGAGGAPDAWRVASKLMFRGRWLRHAGMYPAYQVRLGRRDALRFRMTGHGQRETLSPARVGTLREPLVHQGFSKGISDWVARHNRYSTLEAEEAVRDGAPLSAVVRDMFRRDGVTRRRAAKRLSWRLPCRPTLRFLYMWLLRGGFLDGGPGLEYCRLMAAYEMLTDLKVRELRARRAAGG